MIQLLATKYTRHIACILFIIFFRSIVPAYGSLNKPDYRIAGYPVHRASAINNKISPLKKAVLSENKAPLIKQQKVNIPAKKNIGGPSQPEMSSFKAAGTNNLVNLFTGDFNYNIPLLDVGGYPVNIFYDGGITMEQEASWVGLGWNINPGTVSRNMRGVPDDFNGEEILTQRQEMKPNKTWGVTITPDLEWLGVKDFLNLGFDVSLGSLSFSYNNYLGPALELGIKGGTSITLASKAGSEKSNPSNLNLGLGLGVNISSRNGLTLAPNVSLTANSFDHNRTISGGVRLGTSYNSRSGIKQLQISEQMSYNYQTQKVTGVDKDFHLVYSKNHYGSSMGGKLTSTISFTKPSYVPSIRMPLDNEAYSGNFQIGGGIFGVYGSIEAEVYKQTSKTAQPTQLKPLVGYLYYEKAKNNPNAVMDFSRLNDNEVTPNTPIISATQYSYDVFTIQGEGTGGSIRAYRNDMGYVRDNYTRSRDRSLSVGGDIGIPGHYGANFNTIKTPSTISEWQSGNGLRTAIGFRAAEGAFENVYFRNPGETSVLITDQYNKIGGLDLVRFKLGGSNAAPAIDPVLEHFSKSNQVTGTSNVVQPDITERRKRSQVVSFLTAAEAKIIGLDKDIKSYNPVTILASDNTLQADPIDRIDAAPNGYRRANHISEITVTEANGKRYVYGIPVYNTIQKDYTFTVNGTGDDKDLVNINPSEADQINTAEGKDGYLQMTQTPGYAHSFLLTGLLSSDYVDVTGNGITEDDLGDAVKFNYTRIGEHSWRTPQTKDITANFSAGNLSDKRDDKGIISYGKRESWYLHSIESKTMIALFTLENRDDAKGPATEFGGIDGNDNTSKRLQKIDLYNKADLKKNGIGNAKPIKTVKFHYSNILCSGTPDNPSGGKLTLESIEFSFNGRTRTNNGNKYVFSYTKQDGSGNPIYQVNASDRWGNYKPTAVNPGQVRNSYYPYSAQPTASTSRETINANAAAWSLKRILTPSGGQMEIEYESDDYAYVQNRRACTMMEIEGLSNTPSNFTNRLYGFDLSGTVPGTVEYDHVLIKVPEACVNKQDVYNKYIKGQDQLAFKMSVNMPAGPEYIYSYATVADYDKVDDTHIWIKLNQVSGLSPLSLSALDYLREKLPGQAYPGYDVSDNSGLQAVGEMLAGMLDAIKSAFKDPVKYLRSQGRVQTINPGLSFVRLNVPDGHKYGGGQRVKSIKLRDNWSAMTANKEASAEYGQEYEYTTKEVVNGVEKEISSGVASYEPSIGNEENPFQNIVQVKDKLPLGPASYGAIEMPVLDAFFPAPVVGYSKVTVRSLHKNIDPALKSRSGIGKQVTEFYTAKDFPVYYNHTALDPATDKQKHQATLNAFFYKDAFDSRAISQGFIVETNDMHGKMKSQSSYPENDPNTRIYYTENFYRNTGNKGMDEKFDFIYASQGGLVQPGNMGIDVELMTDTREFSVKSSSVEVQGQVDLFPVIFPFWLPFIWPVVSNSDNVYRAVTTTKVVNYHSVLDSVVVFDKGSVIGTKNLVYDAETGDLVITRTNNEYDKPVYNVKYPAWWAYSGMGPAYKNIGTSFTGYSFIDGKIQGGLDQSLFESGDELYATGTGAASGCSGAPVTFPKLWVFDKNKTNTALTVPAKDLVIMDENGQLLSRTGVNFKIVRSGKRNNLEASVGDIILLSDPVNSTTHKLEIPGNVINASAVEYKEKWQTDNELIKRYSMAYNSSNCTFSEVEDCNGYLQKNINPYRKGLIGNFRPCRDVVFYGNRQETVPTPSTNLPQNGFLAAFQPYWNFNSYNNLVPDNTNPKWVSKSLTTRYNFKGMEVETKDALNIYTAAQYGYHKTLPIAVANNSRYSEMFYEGFEDGDYAEALNPATSNMCAQPHVKIAGLDNSQLVDADANGFNAHTGKYVLGIKNNSTVVKQIAVAPPAAEDFAIPYLNKTPSTLINRGMNYQLVSENPTGVFSSNPNYTIITSGDNDMRLSLDPRLSTVPAQDIFANGISYTFLVSQYVEITQGGVYHFGVTSYRQGGGAGPYGINHLAITFSSVTAGQNVPVNFETTIYEQYPSYNYSWDVYNVCLPKGIYKIEGYLNGSWENYEGGSDGTFPQDNFFFQFLNDPSNILHPDIGNGRPLPGYKSTSTQNVCTYDLPIPATTDMLNPVFTMPSNKRMLFSAWVREQCANCAGTGYVSNQVKIEAGGSPVILTPAGSVIEGWQRYEGEFTTPIGTTTMNVSLVNNSSSMIYFDDIRIHPYNANMKSYVYDPVNLRLTADLDANNYATFYDYDEEGVLVRTRAETREGIKTINETRSARQKTINQIQP